MARPTKATEDNLQEAVRLAAEGKTEKEIARAIGVTRATITNWKNRHPEFLVSLRESKKTPDEKVKVALFERACGYSHDAVKIFLGKDGQVVQVPYVEHYPPDTAACIIWLKNRDPENWRDKQQVEHEFGPTAAKLVERLNRAIERKAGS